MKLADERVPSSNIRCIGRGRGRGLGRGQGQGRGFGHGRGNGNGDINGGTGSDNGISNSNAENDSNAVADLHSFGLALVGFGFDRQNVCDRTNLERFKAFFCVEPTTIQAILVDLEKNHTSIIKKEVLMTFNWLALYDTEHVLAGRWGLHEETIRDKVQEITKKIAELK